MILVFGKTGQVGSELNKFKDVLCVDKKKVNLLNPDSCFRKIIEISPKAVINAAAYTNVKNAEKEKNIANVINGYAPGAMAKACYKLNIPFIHISTDYVFDGNKKNEWRPHDKTNPLNMYGKSKLAGEKEIIKSGVNYVILRTSWIISSRGKNFVKTILELSKNNFELSVVNDQIGGPTPAINVALSCLQIAKMLIEDPKKSGIYHYSGLPNVSWNFLAKKIIELVERKVEVIPVLTYEYDKELKRPLNSILNCETTLKTFGILQPKWRIELKNIIKELGYN